MNKWAFSNRECEWVGPPPALPEAWYGALGEYWIRGAVAIVQHLFYTMSRLFSPN